MLRASQEVQWRKIPLTMQEPQETWFLSLGREDSPEEEMAAHARILAWEIPWREEPGGLQSRGSGRVRQEEGQSAHTTRASASGPSGLTGRGPDTPTVLPASLAASGRC